MDSKISLGQWIKHVSEEHYEIEHMIAQLEDTVVQQSVRSVGLPTISKLVEFCVKHVENEEHIMRLMNDKGFKRHSDDHSRILDTVSAALAEFERLGGVDLLEFARSLREAYKNHIQEFDQPFFTSLYERQLTDPPPN